MTTSMLTQLLIFTVASVALTVGVGAIPLLKLWKEDHLHSFVSFSAGVMMATAFLHLMPDTLERADHTLIGPCILGSFLALFLLEKFVMIHPCEESHCDYHTIGLASFAGMIIHTFFDGLALGSAMLIPGLGWVVFAAIMAHKVPSSFALASILKKARWTNARIALFLLFFSLTIPFGAFCSSTFLKSLGDPFTGIALALSLGTFLYVATSDFLPDVHRHQEHRIKNLLFFFGGITLIAITVIFVPHV